MFIFITRINIAFINIAIIHFIFIFVIISIILSPTFFFITCFIGKTYKIPFSINN